VSFAIPQYLVSNFHGPWLVDVVAAMVSMASLVFFLRIWRPARIWRSPALKGHEAEQAGAGGAAVADGNPTTRHDRRTVFVAWVPWLILTVFVFLWGIPEFKKLMDGISVFRFPIEGLHNMVEKVPPVVAKPVKEGAVYALNYLSATGTGILLAAIIAGLFMKFSPLGLLTMYWRTIVRVRYSLLTIS